MLLEKLRAKRMRAILYLSLALLMITGLAGCTAQTPAAEPASNDPVESSPAKVEEAGERNADSNPVESCPETSPHPVAVDIAETFNVPYEQVIGWFCDGLPFDEILLALQTQEMVDVEVDDLFQARRDDKSWDQIWRDLQIVSD